MSFKVSFGIPSVIFSKFLSVFLSRLQRGFVLELLSEFLARCLQEFSEDFF